MARSASHNALHSSSIYFQHCIIMVADIANGLHVHLFHMHTDVVALKGGYFTGAANMTDILQRDLLCSGSEANLLSCMEYGSGTRDCPADHSEDAGVKCNGNTIQTLNNAHQP